LIRLNNTLINELLSLSPSVRLHCLPLPSIYTHEVDRGEVSLEAGYAAFNHSHGEGEDGEEGDNIEGAVGEVEKVEAGVEQLVAGAHPEENPPVRVVELHGPVPGGIHKLVAALTLEEAGVEVEPVARHVDAHGHLEEEGGGGVEGAERRQQAHGRAPVSQHVQHPSESGALAQQPGRVSVHGVEKTGQQVAGDGHGRGGRHEPEREDRQEDTSVANQIRNEQKHVLCLGQLVHERFIGFGHREDFYL